jgi:hypothetical protein
VIQFILFMLIGVLLFCSLYFLARRKSRSEGGAEALIEARMALTALQAGLLPPEILGRILAREDRDYVVSGASERIRELFFDERKKVALLWVEQVRRQIISLRHFHSSSARFYRQLGPATEMKLAVEFAALLFACRALQCMLYVGGPYAVPSAIGKTAAAASRICALSEKSLGFLSPVHQGPIL